jgi:hypothetical protein
MNFGRVGLFLIGLVRLFRKLALYNRQPSASQRFSEKLSPVCFGGMRCLALRLASHSVKVFRQPFLLVIRKLL